MFVLKWKKTHYTRFLKRFVPPGSTILESEFAEKLLKDVRFQAAVKCGAASLQEKTESPAQSPEAEQGDLLSGSEPEQPKEKPLSVESMRDVIADMFDVPALRKIAAEDSRAGVKKAAEHRIKELLETGPE